MGRITRILISKIFSLLTFILIVFLLKLISPSINSSIFSGILRFFNDNISYIVVMSIIIAVGEILYEIMFPINMLAPLLAAFGSVLLVRFLFRMFGMIETVMSIRILYIFTFFAWMIYAIVFIVVIIVGYARIFSRFISPHKDAPKKKKENPKEINVGRIKTWRDIGDEFRQTISDFLAFLRKKMR